MASSTFGSSLCSVSGFFHFGAGLASSTFGSSFFSVSGFFHFGAGLASSAFGSSFFSVSGFFHVGAGFASCTWVSSFLPGCALLDVESSTFGDDFTSGILLASGSVRLQEYVGLELVEVELLAVAEIPPAGRSLAVEAAVAFMAAVASGLEDHEASVVDL